jgi:site-specific DNA recombinase
VVIETARRTGRNGNHPQPMRRVGLVVRVSTERQAASEEGSLKNQLQRLRQHIEYKRSVAGEEWVEAAVYELRAVSGKNSLRSAEFERLFEDVRSGRINTILCPALDRISRSVKDFLNFFEFINEHGVEFVCLKQNYDTTTPQGRLFVTMMIALAEFEREQTAERTREATAARAERGLWNGGGQLLGYDLDADRKGHLIPNAEEAVIVNLAFDTYLECGSITETACVLNGRGYRTKAYTSRCGRRRAGRPFTISSVQYMLKNPAYVGKKEINRKAPAEERSLVEAVWPGIVDEEKFLAVQRLMAANGRTNHNGAKAVRHCHVLSGGLLHCGRCDSVMEGRSGTGRLGTRYYYYVCRNRGCGLRVAAHEVEDAVAGRIQTLAEGEEVLEFLVGETNKRMLRRRPALERQRRSLQRTLDEVRAEADGILAGWASLEQESGRSFLTEKLGRLAERRGELEHGLADVSRTLAQIDEERVTAETVRASLTRFRHVYEQLTPFERKELMRLLLHRAEVSERRIVLEIYPVTAPEMAMPQSRSRSEAPNWLPGQDSNLQPSG